VLWKSLELAGELVLRGERNAQTIAARMREVIETAEDARIEYVAIADPDTLLPVEIISGRVVALLAVKIDNTRLIDNCFLYATDSLSHSV